MDAVYQVYKDILSPFILFVGKFSKEVYGEPKEQMFIKSAVLYKLRPKHVVDPLPSLE
jgi:hypothetical protein